MAAMAPDRPLASVIDITTISGEDLIHPNLFLFWQILVAEIKRC
jgi:hypothetical protein